MRPILKTIYPLAIILALASPALMEAQHAIIAPRNLQQLSREAETIVHGRILSVMVEPHPEFKSLQTVLVRMAVMETLKGNPAPVFTFRQFIWGMRNKADAAGYREGQEVLLLMIHPSQYGLSSPAGMEQGRFLIRNASGNRVASNGRGNAELFRGMQLQNSQASQASAQLSPGLAQLVQEHRSGPLALDDLTQIIRTLVSQERP